MSSTVDVAACRLLAPVVRSLIVATSIGDRRLLAYLRTLLNPIVALQSFPKVATQYMTVMHFVCRAHLESLAALPAQMFLQIVRSLSEGLDSLESEIANQAAYALDHLASSYVRNAKKDSQLGQALRMQLQANPVIFQTLMQILFQILVFSETQNQYTLARPMLPIIIAAEFVRPDVSNSPSRYTIARAPVFSASVVALCA